jgi:hypothetical protein
MHGPCLECNYPADGAACSLCGLTAAESLEKNADDMSEKFRKMMADAVASAGDPEGDKAFLQIVDRVQALKKTK